MFLPWRAGWFFRSTFRLGFLGQPQFQTGKGRWGSGKRAGLLFRCRAGWLTDVAMGGPEVGTAHVDFGEGGVTIAACTELGGAAFELTRTSHLDLSS